jgi:pimeloyl-ACP methyl ester carboxylesterase
LRAWRASHAPASGAAVRRVFALSLLLFSGASPPYAAAPAQPPARTPPPLQIDLDAFDAMKQSVLLPNGIRLSYIITGNLSGPPVVLVHGYTDSARDWVPLLPYLSKAKRLILVDLRGHGGSAKPECCYARIDFAYDIKLLLEALKIPRADFVGHSLGSLIVQAFAEAWPERTWRVVLISSTAGVPACAPPHTPAFDFDTASRNLKEPIEADSPFLVAWWDSPTPVDPEFIRRQRRDSAAIPLVVWRAVLDQGMNYADLKSKLPRLTAPALLVWGSEDPIMEEDARANLRESLPHAEVKMFQGLGHNPFWEDPVGVAAVINHFLEPP